MSNFKIIFVHGYTASPLGDWYPNISKSLDDLHVEHAVPHLPGGKKPHAKEWLESIDREVKQSHKPVVLVGHSLGTRTVLLYIEKYEQPVKAAFLIAAFANRTENAERKGGDAYPDFFEHTIDLNIVKSLCDKFVVIHSRDDGSIDYDQGQEIAGELGAKLVTLDGRGHMSAADNAPFVLKELREELGF